MIKKDVILEIKRASPSKKNIAENLNAAETALIYKQNGAGAISCLTEENYFKGSLHDLMQVCDAVPDVAVLRKDFLIDEAEIEISYKCGADAVLLIAGILSIEELFVMTKKCHDFGIRAFIEVRTEEDVEKVLKIKNQYADTIVCGVNSRNLKDFSIDLLVPAMLKNKLGGSVIFESGIETPEAAANIAAMGFTGILLGEFAVRNLQNVNKFVKAFFSTKENLYGKQMLKLAEKLNKQKTPLIKICGLTQKEDVLLADSLGADFVGFIFASGFQRNVCGEKFDEIKEILSSVKAFKVAVITDPHSKEAKNAAIFVKNSVLDFLQFHGIEYEEIPDYMKELPHYFAISSDKTDMLLKQGEPRFLQDVKTHEYDTSKPLWIAGGITADNVASLVNEFKPELVDVSSGIENQDKIGIKNHEKMHRFFNQIQLVVKNE